MNAKEKIMKRSITAKAFTIAAITALALALAPMAKAQGKPCSNATLKGTFADRDTGTIIGVGPYAGVILERFSGTGKLTGSGVQSINGTVAAGTFAGTYEVKPDCTGTYTVHTPQGRTFHASFVIDDDGNELQILITDPGTVINCLARRQFPVGDSEQ